MAKFRGLYSIILSLITFELILLRWPIYFLRLQFIWCFKHLNNALNAAVLCYTAFL